jgi:myo-inositol-1(or 4)-monophosphatase
MLKLEPERCLNREKDVMEPTLGFLKEMATHAGGILLQHAANNFEIKHKSRKDLVTSADHASESYLIDTIRRAFPNHAINAEESGELRGEGDHKWFIDPLDGTINFAHGIPFYCVSIGYAIKGELNLGVVYDPNRDECFSTERGQGATLNGSSIHVADQRDLIECLLATGFPRDLEDTPGDNLRNFVRLNRSSQTVRRMGSAALDIAYVAAGRLDGYWSVEIYQWDVGAASLMVSEAGGMVTDISGGSDFMTPPVSILCANPTIHAKMLEVLESI